MRLAQQLLMWFKKFCKGDGRHEEDEWTGCPSEGDNNELRAIIEADPLTTTWEVAEEFSVNHSKAIQHLKQIWEVKKLDKWVPRELAKNKNIVVLKCHHLLFCATTMNHFLIRLWHRIKSGFYPTTDDDQFSGCTEKKLESTSQSQTCTRKRSRSLVVFCPFDPLQLSESSKTIPRTMLSKSMRCTENATPAASIGQQKGPNSSPRQHPTVHHTAIASNVVEWIGLQSFASSAIFTWLLTNRWPLLQLPGQFFAGKMLPQPEEGRKCLPRVVQIQKHGFLCYRNTSTYFSLAKCVDCYGTYFD